VPPIAVIQVWGSRSNEWRTILQLNYPEKFLEGCKLAAEEIAKLEAERSKTVQELKKTLKR
jgi:hypothetical protein